MKYYIAKGPIVNTKYTWDLSLYKIHDNMCAEAIRFYLDGTIIKDVIEKFNVFFIKNHCKEISQEEYEQILEI